MNVWRERLQRWIAPVAARITVSANTITAVALLTNLIAATMLGAGRIEPLLFPLAAFAIAIGGLLDALDGAVARARGETSKWGDFLDHLFDRISDTAILIGWCIGASIRPPLTIAVVIAVLLNGYTGTQIEATFGRRSYSGTGRGEFVIAAVTFPLIQFALAEGGLANARILAFTIAEWLTSVLAAFAVVGMGERFSEARRMAR